jgi:hypothetical protein
VGVDLVSTGVALVRQRQAADGEFPHGDFRLQQLPGPQAGLPGGAAAPVRPAVDVFVDARLDLADLTVPPLPDGQSPGELRSRGRLDRWLAFAPLAMVLYLILTVLVDLLPRTELSRARRAVWIVSLVALPGLGAVAYFLAARPRLGRWPLVGFALGLVAYLGVVATAVVANAG